MSDLTDRLRTRADAINMADRFLICDEVEISDYLVCADLREAADEIDRLTRELANAHAADIHSCHDNCQRAGCVNARLREDAERYRWLRDGDLGANYPYPVMREGTDGMNDRTIWFDELDAAIDHAMGARKATP